MWALGSSLQRKMLSVCVAYEVAFSNWLMGGILLCLRIRYLQAEYNAYISCSRQHSKAPGVLEIFALYTLACNHQNPS